MPPEFERPVQSRAAVEELWRKRLQEAEVRHNIADHELNKAMEDLTGGLVLPPDGSTAVRNARVAKSAALNEWMRVLRVFTDLILYNKVPDGD